MQPLQPPKQTDPQDTHLDSLERLACAVRSVATWEDFSEIYFDISRWHYIDADGYRAARQELSDALKALR